MLNLAGHLLALYIYFSTVCFAYIVPLEYPDKQQHRLSSSNEPNDLVFLISIDGLRYDYLTRQREFNLSLPNINNLIASQNAVHLPAYSVYPALTFPSHTSMITGVYPDKHGVYQNDKFDPNQEGKGLYMFSSDLKVKTIFDYAKQFGIESSAVTWPVSAFSESIKHSLPDAPSRTPVEFDYYWNGCIRGDLFKQLLDTPSKLKALDDSVRVNLTISLIDEHFGGRRDRSQMPRLNALHLVDFDHWQHVYGAFSKPALEALELEDAYIGQLVSKLNEYGLYDKSHIMIVSDHGFGNITKMISPGVLLSSTGLLDKTADGMWKVAQYVSPGVYAVYINEALADDVKQEIYVQLGDVFEYFKSNAQKFGIQNMLVGHDSVMNAALNGYPGAYAIMEAKETYWFSTGTTGLIFKEIQIPNYTGTHGYNPQMDFMRATFIAKSPLIQKDQVSVESVRLVDIAPTAARLLGFEMDQLDGCKLNDIFSGI